MCPVRWTCLYEAFVKSEIWEQSSMVFGDETEEKAQRVIGWS